MTERSRFWNGTSVGDATEAPYDADTEVAEVLSTISGGAGLPDSGGVFSDQLNELAVSTSPGFAQVATGRAIVAGTWYENDVPVNVAVPTPSANTRIDRIVLRKSWSAQTVRITRIAGVEGGAAPAITQNDGTTWDVKLAQVSITTGGVITITDEREFVTMGSGTGGSYAPFIPAGAFELPSSGFPNSQKYVSITNWPAIRVLGFDAGSTEAAYAGVPIPSGLSFSAIRAKIIWFSDATTSGVARWQLTRLSRADDEAIDTAGTAQAVDSTVPGTARRFETAIIDMDLTGIAVDEVLLLKLERVGGHANDTLANDALFYGLQLEFN